MSLNFSKNELIHARFTLELKNFAAYCSILNTFGKTWLYLVLHDFNLTYYSSFLLASYYSQNYAGILASPLLIIHILPYGNLLQRIQNFKDFVDFFVTSKYLSSKL